MICRSRVRAGAPRRVRSRTQPCEHRHMARRRFLVDHIRDNAAELRGEDARHLARVLRAEPGQQYEIADGACVCLAEIAVVERDRVIFRVVEALDTPALPVRLTLFAAIVKFDRFEWLVEKVTELGVAAIVPVSAARSEKGLLEGARKRAARWRRIAHESAQQARRLKPPEIGEPIPLAAAITSATGHRYFLDEQPGAPPLAAAIPPSAERHITETIALLTGPEGGWTGAERAAAIASGWTPVSLGPLILRAETAAIAAAGILTHAWWASQLE
jgi:16S rRNA (uracil1498-N3)-methyltransferase